jgi:hypothetical protein
MEKYKESLENRMNLLVKRIVECVDLSIPEDRIDRISAFISRHSRDLICEIMETDDKEFIQSKFSNFINKSLSTIEALGLKPEQYRAVRKLVLSEINGCKEVVLRDLDLKIKK